VTVLRLLVIWAWFTGQLVAMPCLAQPQMVVLPELPGHALGRYDPWLGIVYLDADAPPMVAVHEYAHHWMFACHLDERPLGRRFLRAVGASGWGALQHEQFAQTLTWVLLGHGGTWPTVRSAAWVFAPKLVPDG